MRSGATRSTDVRTSNQAEPGSRAAGPDSRAAEPGNRGAPSDRTVLDHEVALSNGEAADREPVGRSNSPRAGVDIRPPVEPASRVPPVPAADGANRPAHRPADRSPVNPRAAPEAPAREIPTEGAFPGERAASGAVVSPCC